MKNTQFEMVSSQPVKFHLKRKMHLIFIFAVIGMLFGLLYYIGAIKVLGILDPIVVIFSFLIERLGWIGTFTLLPMSLIILMIFISILKGKLTYQKVKVLVFIKNTAQIFGLAGTIEGLMSSLPILTRDGNILDNINVLIMRISKAFITTLIGLVLFVLVYLILEFKVKNTNSESVKVKNEK